MRLLPLVLLLTLLFSGTKAYAVRVQGSLGYGLGMGGTLTADKSFATQSQHVSFSTDYRGNPRWQLLASGKEQFLLGGALHGGSITYRTSGVENRGYHLAFGIRVGWLHEWTSGWALEVVPELLIFSRLMASSFSQSNVEGSSFQSSSVSTYSGNGLYKLRFTGLRKLPYAYRGFGSFVGLSFDYMQQNFSSRAVSVVATAPTSGETASTEQTRRGSFSWNVSVLQLQLGVTY